MPLNELAHISAQELQVKALDIEYRRQWYAFRALDRLEAAFNAARSRFAARPATVLS